MKKIFKIFNLTLDDSKLAQTLSRILTRTYEPMNDFQKMHAIYTPWYNTENIHKFHKEVMNHILDIHFAKLQEAGIFEVSKLIHPNAILDY